MQETMPGARRRGKPRTTWTDNKTRTGLLLEESIRKTENKTGVCGQPSDRGRPKNRTDSYS